MPLPIEDEIAISGQAITAMLTADAQAPAQDEPGLAAHFRRFHALAVGTRDEALLPELRALLQARVNASLDDSQALEFALTRWFIESETPPLTLLFETGRAFEWHAHVVRLSSWLSPWALRQMEARLMLSRDLVYARHFSGNRWLRRLHSPRNGLTLIAGRPSVLEAQLWAQRWQHSSADADATSLASCLNQRTLKRLDGSLLLTTDLFAGLGVAAAWASTPVEAAICAFAAAAGLFVARLLLHVIRHRPETHWSRRAARLLDANRPAVAMLSIVTGVLGGVVLTAPEAELAAKAAGSILLAPIFVAAAALAWRIAAWIELAVALPFGWREAVDRLEFDRCVVSRVAADPARPFGTRLSWLARWRSIPEALRLQRTELTLRARPPRARPFRLVRIVGSNGKPGIGRFAWFLAWIVFAIARVAHLIGSN